MVFRQNVTASGARPNPQGSFHYGSVNVTDVYILKSVPPVTIDRKRRSTYNGISFVYPETPMRLSDIYHVPGDYKLDFPNKPMNRPPKMDKSIINGTYKGFIEIILQNNDTVVQSFHMDGYSFFVVGYNSLLKYAYYERPNSSNVYIGVIISVMQDGLWRMDREQQRFI